MLDLIRKRHAGDGWLVFTELGNRPGYYANRFADAFALGVWASTKYETHLYEEKRSREDLKKELSDPTKMDGVGKYARYRWLVVSDEKIMEGLAIPDAWGVLAPTVRGNQRLLKVIQKAPKLDAKPIDAMFAMSMVRNGLKGWVSTADHQKVVDELASLRGGLRIASRDDEIASRDEKIRELQVTIKQYERQIQTFEEASGVRLDLSGYQAGQIGKAVKLVVAMQEHGQPLDALGAHVAHLSTQAAELHRRAEGLATAAVTLRRDLELEDKDHSSICVRKQGWNNQQCTCGKVPGSPFEVGVAERLAAKRERHDA